MRAYVCTCVYVCICGRMHAYTHEVQQYAIQFMHAAMVQTSDHRKLHKHMYLYIQLMHAAIVQEIDQRAQTYAVQQMHATIIQTIGHRALHNHMQFNPCMQQFFKQLIKELRNTVNNMQTYACIHAGSTKICNSTYACLNGPSNRS